MNTLPKAIVKASKTVYKAIHEYDNFSLNWFISMYQSLLDSGLDEPRAMEISVGFMKSMFDYDMTKNPKFLEMMGDRPLPQKNPFETPTQ